MLVTVIYATLQREIQKFPRDLRIRFWVNLCVCNPCRPDLQLHPSAICAYRSLRNLSAYTGLCDSVAMVRPELMLEFGEPTVELIWLHYGESFAAFNHTKLVVFLVGSVAEGFERMVYTSPTQMEKIKGLIPSEAINFVPLMGGFCNYQPFTTQLYDWLSYCFSVPDASMKRRTW